MNTIDDLKAWTERLFRFVSRDKAMEEVSGVGALGHGAERLNFRLYTDTHAYAITARAPAGDDSGYLGCISSRRKPLAGEDWTRGRDLADGPFSHETWMKIVADIVATELVPLEMRPSVPLVTIPVDHDGRATGQPVAA